MPQVYTRDIQQLLHISHYLDGCPKGWSRGLAFERRGRSVIIQAAMRTKRYLISWCVGCCNGSEISPRFPLEILGIAIIVPGGLAACDAFARSASGCLLDASYRQYRRGLGRAILLGLEFLVGAGIIATVAIEPNYRNVGVLALIVVIRTFLSFSLEVEIDGRWPWQPRDARKHGGIVRKAVNLERDQYRKSQ